MNLFQRHLVRNAADAGGAGGGAQGAAPAGNGDAPASISPPSPPASGPPPAGAATIAPAEIYRPDGVIDNLIGKNDRETMDNMAKALRGYRERDSANEIPKDPTAYSAFPDDLPEPIRPHIATLTNDPLFSRVATAAHKLEISPAKFQQLMTETMTVAHEMGIMEPPIDVEAERAALVPDNARQLPPAEQARARNQRMNDNFAYLDQLAARGANQGGLDRETVNFAKAMLGDSAKGHVFIEFLRGQMSPGKGAVVNPGATSGNDPRAELARRAALPENIWGNPKFDKASYAQLKADYQKLIPNE